MSIRYRTDHSLIYLKLNLYDERRGPGFWKMNTSLLHDLDYIALVQQAIKDVIDIYAVPGQDVRNQNIRLNIDDQLFFEMLKMEVRGRSISYSAKKKKESVKKEKQVEN